MPTSEQLETRLFGALLDPFRRAILRELASEGGVELSVTEIATRTGRVLVNASHHMRALLDAGLVEYRKSGVERLYRLTPGLWRQTGIGDWEIVAGPYRVSFRSRDSHGTRRSPAAERVEPARGADETVVDERLPKAVQKALSGR